MNAKGRIKGWALAAVAAGLAASAWAQSEQWLQYKTGAEGIGYTWIELSTSPPVGVALPKLNAPAWFGRWSTPLDSSGGRWVCLDRARGSGVPDRLYCDRNGNGRLDDEAPLTPSRREESGNDFEAIKILFKGEDGPVTYHLSLRVLRYGGDEVRLLAEAGCWYEGKVTLGGKKVMLRLEDRNVNGAFNDIAVNAREGDALLVGEKLDDSTARLSVGRLLEWEGEYYALEVARDGAFVKLKRAEGLRLASVKAPASISSIVVAGENGEFRRKPTNSLFVLPAGDYVVRWWEITRKDAKGSSWTLTAYDDAGALAFEAGAGEAGPLAIGEPLRAVLQASESKNGIAFSLRVQGPNGESTQILKGADRPRAPQLILASRDGSYRATNSFEYG